MRRQLRLDLSSNTSTIFHCLPSAYFCTGLMEVDFFFFFPLGKEEKIHPRSLFSSKKAVSIVYVYK